MGFFQKLFGTAKNALCAPVAGEAVALSEVNDPTFAMELVGKGMAVRPAEGKIVAPCAGSLPYMVQKVHIWSL